MTWQLKLLVLAPLMVVFFALSFFVFPPDGEEVGRLAFTGPGTTSSTLLLNAGEVSFWTDVDIRYEGASPLAYHVDLSQGGSQVATASCDPLASKSVELSWLKTFDGVTHLERGRGKMGCTATLPASGPTTIAATLLLDSHGSPVTLKKADLAIRQVAP